ncbi:MAG TPA: TetR/AcrR family transcriptional regulator [Herpetosiphonaceae bacterium]
MSYHQSQPSQDERIEAAARELLGEQGTGFTVDELARRAGLSRASLYRQIGSKAALLARLAQAGAAAPPDARAKILLAARRVFAQAGFASATMEQIAQAAGVGVATVYRQFGDKDQLTRSLISELSPADQLREPLIHPSGDVRADLRRIAESVVPFFYQQRDLLRLMVGGSDADQAYLERLRAGAERTRDLLTGYFGAQQLAGRLRQDIAPAELAMALVGMVLGFVVGPVRFGLAPPPPERISEVIAGLLLDGTIASSEDKP